ncbi:intermembrane lipid transfer protein vps13B [Condylostylus longicornis]|uniref:intermembrane lipid transfer protein vps13B n=1 Tax=Condylostylus longicornis TaxID=2530218 RepID=UPI00244E31D7|nr:intermembrane lipid transfer protein vps13B [Condylostylus longicornis]
MVSTRQMSTTLAAPTTGPSNDEVINYSIQTTATTSTTTTARYTSVISTRHSNSQSFSPSTTSASPIFLLDLPIEILDKIFSYVGYKKLGQLRVVSKQMNQIGGTILNSTFQKLQTQMLNRFQTVKAKMPRRESARRNHPLACECDIIETCHMRLSLLQMTFGKHIERKHCCFFPGGILDEVYNVLNYIRTTPKLERPYRVTDELFDLSTMAMEYFKEHIEPNLPEIAYFNKDFFGSSSKCKQTYSLKAISDISESCSSSSSPPQSNMVLRKGIRKIKQGMKMYNNQLTVLRSELRNCKRKSSEQGKQIAEQQKLLADQQKQTLEYANRLDENDKKNEEMSRKFSTLLQELNKCKTELQYWRSKSPAIQVCNSCGHKITPVIAPDDFQALINQGVKPEDIISIDDVEDSDTSSNNALCDSDLDTSTGTPTNAETVQQHNSTEGVASSNNMTSNQSTNVFVFPDETTTAKLLAVNSIKNLKRNYDGTSVVSLTSSAPPSTSTVTTISNNAFNQLNSKGCLKESSNFSNSTSNNSNSNNLAQTSFMESIENYSNSQLHHRYHYHHHHQQHSEQQKSQQKQQNQQLQRQCSQPQQQQQSSQKTQHPQQNQFNQKHNSDESSAFCSIDTNANKLSTASIGTETAISSKSAITSTVTNVEQLISAGSANVKNSLKSIPTINPSTFYPSSISAFNESTLATELQNSSANSVCSPNSGSNITQVITNAETISAGQENKKRRVQKSGKRKI